MANRTWENAGHFYAMHKMPSLVDCSFVIDVANANGLGVSGLRGTSMIAQVFGHTSATPAVYNGITNNLVAGFYQIFFKDSYYKYFGGFNGFMTQNSGSNISISAGLSLGVVYVITSVGTSTAANWQAVGLPVGILPAVGVSFQASTTSAGTGTGIVQVSQANGSGIHYIEVVGDPTTTLYTTGIGANSPYIIVRTMAPTNSSTTTPIATQPADKSTLNLALYLSNSYSTGTTVF